MNALFANAGHGLGHAFLDQDPKEWRHVIDTNITGLVALTRALPSVRIGVPRAPYYGAKLQTELPDATLVPTGALFRRGEGWAAFVVRAGRATRVDVDAGRSDGRRTEVRAGLAPGDVVVAYPSDRVADGVKIEPRAP